MSLRNSLLVQPYQPDQSLGKSDYGKKDITKDILAKNFAIFSLGQQHIRLQSVQQRPSEGSVPCEGKSPALQPNLYREILSYQIMAQFLLSSNSNKFNVRSENSKQLRLQPNQNRNQPQSKENAKSKSRLQPLKQQEKRQRGAKLKPKMKPWGVEEDYDDAFGLQVYGNIGNQEGFGPQVSAGSDSSSSSDSQDFDTLGDKIEYGNRWP
ncbi:hypothetical protein BC835DRAFT_1307196 [Cytidiella melzeri]|nr:hypothetical protein BC835DRAFT_1307196 [Cytidiella melzeri]